MGPHDRSPRFFLGLDLGGTNIKSGVVDGLGQPKQSISAPTRAWLGPEVGIEILEKVAREALASSGLDWSEIEAIGLGVAGTLDTTAGRIVESSNLSLWNGFDIAPRLRGRLGRPTILVNDANAAVFGEYWAGAGRETESLALFTLGTGIGCGVVESGRLLEGRHGLGGEFGHVTIQMDGGRLCSCGRRGHLEAYASATSLVARAIEALADDVDSRLHIAKADGPLSSEVIARWAKNGDPLAQRLLDETARYLAVGASTVMHSIDPDLILFGGGMIAAGLPFLEVIRSEVRNLAFPAAWQGTRIEFAELGGDAGWIGAAGWAAKMLRES